MIQNYFSLEVEDGSFYPIIGCLNITSINQFFNAFIIHDSKLIYFQNNKDEIIDTIKETPKLYEYIYNLIDGEKNLEKCIKEIEKMDVNDLQKLNKLFNLEILQESLQTPSYTSNEVLIKQKGGSISHIVGAIVVIGAFIYKNFGKRVVRRGEFNINKIHISPQPGKCFVLVINSSGLVRSKIIKVTCNPNYFTPYLTEIEMYDILRQTSRAEIAEFTQGGQITADYNFQLGQHIANINLDGIFYQFEISEIADIFALQTYHSQEIARLEPIIFVYIAGNYYRETMDFYSFLRLDPNIYDISYCVEHILRNIDRAYSNVGFIHGDMKIDNILIETSNTNTAQRSLIFDLDFSLAFRNSDYQILNNQMVNNYLLIGENGTNRLYKNFLHFFDIYLFNVSLQSYITSANFRRIVDDIKSLCDVDPNRIPNSFKYFVVIFWLTAHYEIHRNRYNNNMLNFNNIKRNFLNFRTTSYWNRLDDLGQETYREIRDIIKDQYNYAL